MNPNSSATSKQCWALFCGTGKDFRPLNLTMGVASTLISAIQPHKGDKKAALSVIEKLLSGQTVAEPISNGNSGNSNNSIPIISRDESFRLLFDKAHAAGMAAGDGIIVTPMLVGSPSTPLGNDIDPSRPTYHVPDGVCGFAWISVRPGNCPFANWLKKNDLGKADHYSGGVQIWVGEFGQSMQRKVAYADAFAATLTKEGIKAYAGERMD